MHARVARPHLSKSFKQTGLILGPNTHAGVAHAKDDRRPTTDERRPDDGCSGWSSVVGGHALARQVNPHCAMLGELDRIVGQIDNNLAERSSISLKRNWLRRNSQIEAQPFLFGQ